MNIKIRMIFITLPGLLVASALIAGCTRLGIYDYAGASDVAGELVRGDGADSHAEIVIPATSMSGYSKVALKEDGKAAIDEYKKSHDSELKAAYRILVVGHADTSGNAIVNKSLSLKRAQCVADYLVSTGVDADKIRVIGRGSREPVASNETSAGRAQNRRVEILVVAEDRALDRILFPGDALFESNSAGLTAEGRTYLEEKRLETRDLLNGATYVEIVGHTDDAGDDNENMVLSKLRATTVRDYLVGQGLDGSKVFTAGKGETMPIASNNTDKGRARNRRVQIFIFGRAGEPPL